MEGKMFNRNMLIFLTLLVSSIVALPAADPAIRKPLSNTDPIEITKDDIKIYFFDQNDTSNGTEVDITDEEAVQNTTFSNTKQTFFVVHGWSNYYQSEMCTTVTSALLSAHDVNVFVVDWSSYAELAYPEAFAQVSNVGEMLATLISSLESNNNLDLNKTAIVGHSLGAHIAGVAGTALDSKCSYVIGADPAGPLFSYNVTSNRITTTSAQFVQIIHTSGNHLGLYDALGHADYYVNGGEWQNGCPTSDYGACSHGRSYLYYAESVVSGGFVAQNCASYAEYENVTCTGSTSWLGGYGIDTSANGSYYLDTNAASPYSES